MKLPSYPIHLQLEGRRVLVVGAGRVATRKIERLVECGPEVHVVTQEASAPIRRLAAEGRLTLSVRAFSPADAQGMFLVIAATDDSEVNARVAHAAHEAGALISRVDDPDGSDFTVPAMARGGHVDATVSTNGAAPAASRRLGRELGAWITRGPDRFADEMARARRALHGHPQATERLRKLGDSALFEACAANDEPRIRAIVASALGESA